MNTFEEICKGLNWQELADQKKVIALLEKEQTEYVMNIWNDRPSRRKAVGKAKALQGLIKFIEKLQDAATETYGVKESEVHPILVKIRLIGRAKKNKN